MSFDCFLKIEATKSTVKGEASGDKTYEDQIPVLKYSFGMKTATDYATSMATGKMQIEEVELTFRSSKATPTLVAILSTNEEIKTATMTCRKASGSGEMEKFLEWKFTKARISAFHQITAPNPHTQRVDDTVILDVIRIAYQTGNVEYFPQKDSGSKDASRTQQYSVNRN